MSPEREHHSGPSRFLSTAWSVVARAQDRSNEEYRESIERLCRDYWKPVYRYMRRRRLSHDDAVDATQEYFALFLEKGFVETADRERGKFRTFILTTVSRFLSKRLKKQRHDRANVPLTVRMEDDGEFMLPDASTDFTPEDEFNRSWARTLIARTLERMADDCTEGNRLLYRQVFETYLDSTTDPNPKSYRDIADELGITETDVTNYLHRGRNIFQKLLREEIRQSVLTESEVDEEIDALRAYFAS